MAWAENSEERLLKLKAHKKPSSNQPTRIDRHIINTCSCISPHRIPACLTKRCILVLFWIRQIVKMNVLLSLIQTRQARLSD